MSLDAVPPNLRAKYRWAERHHGVTILAADFPAEWEDLCACLASFALTKDFVTKPGGNKSLVAHELDNFLYGRGWAETDFDVDIKIDEVRRDVPTHKIDSFRNRVGVEVEWNSKDSVYDRDLNNFRLLHQHGVLSVGVIITRQTEIRTLFERFGKKWEASTTHWDKLIPKVDGGGAAGCPLVLIGLGEECFDANA